jgi:hypothetical protein
MARVVLLSSTTRYALCSATAASLVVATLVSSPSTPPSARAQARAPSRFAAEIASLSEPAGYFDTDNLISNERSYLHAMTDLSDAHLHGGAYIGVGPDQNFSYIAQIRPTVAFIIDIRRDNLLLHLLFKALFQTSATRAEYLSHLFARRMRPPPDQWRAASLEKILAELDSAEPREEDARGLRKTLETQIAGFGVPLSPQDYETIDRFHRTFIDAGLGLKFQTFGRAPQSYYPTYRELLFETNRQGQRANFLMAEDDYQFVRGLQQRDLIVPVVGNVAGPSALAAIGRAVRRRGEAVTVFYVSNVELYLFRDGLYSRYADTVSALPRNSHSLLIRSIFSGPGFWSLPDKAPGYASASLTERIDDFAADHAAHKDVAYESVVVPHH